MSVRRVRAPEWLAGAAGLVLLVSLFLPWYDVPPPGAGRTGALIVPSSVSAWQAFTVTDVVLALLALAGPAMLAAQATRVSPALPNGVTVIELCCAAVASLLVIARLILQPGPNDLVDVRAGAWIALAAALALFAAGWWSLGRERSPGAPMPDVELRRAPPAAG